MARIIPSEENSQPQSTTPKYKTIELSQGLKILAPIGASYRHTMNGKRFCEIRFVCLKNLEKGGDNETGAIIEERYFLEENNNWVWSRLSSSLGYTEPFDNENAQDIEKLLMKNGNRIQAKITEKEYNGKVSLTIKEMGKVLKDNKIPPYTEDEQLIIAKAMDDFGKVLNWRKDQGWQQELLPYYTSDISKNVKDQDFDNTDDEWDTVPF